MKAFRMTCAVIAVVIIAMAVYAIGKAEQPEEKSSRSRVRVGTFDSRSVALVYYNSETFRSYIKGLKAETKKAEADGDEERVEKLRAEGEALQELTHKQGFSTWPVDNILDKIKGKIPEIAKQADVDLIVSKWDIVYQRPELEFIDVTDLMVKPFDPSEQTLSVLEELKKQDPIPLEELKKCKH
ncbi:MAG: hypothetical protein KAH12_00255 [Anaerolineales bacterium]|nr:hypothetical protein [Anaerolineales bacterium]